MALDYNQKTYSKTIDQAVVDEGLRKYMLQVYNYMTTGLLLTGIIAFLFGKASVISDEGWPVSRLDTSWRNAF